LNSKLEMRYLCTGKVEFKVLNKGHVLEKCSLNTLQLLALTFIKSCEYSFMISYKEYIDSTRELISWRLKQKRLSSKNFQNPLFLLLGTRF